MLLCHPTCHATADLPWTVEEPEGFELYTDGAFRRQMTLASADIVLIVKTANGDRFGGFHAAWCSGTPSAPRGETTAVAIAVFWAVQLVTRYPYGHLPFCFYFDSSYAGNAAQGRRAHLLNPDLTKIVRSLTLWLDMLLVHPAQWHHVRGHSNHPWNELADTVAARVCKECFVTLDTPTFVALCSFDDADHIPLQWLWLFEGPLRGYASAPPLHGTTWKLNLADPLLSVPDADLHPFLCQQSEPSHAHDSMEPVTLRCATANVLTMYPDRKHSATFFSARAEELEGQFHAAQLHCVGLQETRCRRDGHDVLGHYHVFSSSASSKGHGGIQLWFTRTLSTDQGCHRFEHDHFRILHADDRRLFVRIQHPSLRLLLIVLHAPCDEHEAALRQWHH